MLTLDVCVAHSDKWVLELRWSFTIVGTRCYGPRFAGDGSTLIPILDLLNHQNNGSLSHYIASDTNTSHILGYGKRATMSYVPGEEVWASYTGWDNLVNCNHALFNSWGFTLDEPHSKCALLTILYRPPDDADLRQLVVSTLDRLNVTQVNAAGNLALTVTVRADGA